MLPQSNPDQNAGIHVEKPLARPRPKAMTPPTAPGPAETTLAFMAR